MTSDKNLVVADSGSDEGKAVPEESDAEANGVVSEQPVSRMARRTAAEAEAATWQKHELEKRLPQLNQIKPKTSTKPN